MEKIKKERFAVLLLKGLTIDEVSELTSLIKEERLEWHKQEVKKLAIHDVSNCAYLKHELEVTDQLLNERQRVLDAIPECEIHGKCVPHAIEFIEEMKAKHCC